MLHDYRIARDRVARALTRKGGFHVGEPGIHYVLAALLLVCVVAAAFILSGGRPHEQLAHAPAGAPAATQPAPATPAPSPGPQE